MKLFDRKENFLGTLVAFVLFFSLVFVDGLLNYWGY